MFSGMGRAAAWGDKQGFPKGTAVPEGWTGLTGWRGHQVLSLSLLCLRTFWNHGCSLNPDLLLLLLLHLCPDV